MEWVEGNSFSQYIEQNLHSSENLLSLADEFKRMVLGLKGAGVAHGDLQHGNIIMCGNELRLVDYDGMFVPALAGDNGKGSLTSRTNPTVSKHAGSGLVRCRERKTRQDFRACNKNVFQ